MRFRASLLACSLTLALAPMARAAEVGEALQARDLHTLDGQTADLSTLEGQTVVVNFWAEWCAPCRRELPILDAWNDEFSGRGVRFVAISIDKEPRRARRMAKRMGLTLPLYHDGPDGLAAQLGLPALPITYVISPDGDTVFTSLGIEDEAMDELKAEIERQLSRSAAAANSQSTGAER